MLGRGTHTANGKAGQLVSLSCQFLSGQAVPRGQQNALHAKVHRHDNSHVLISMHFCCADMESPSHEGLLQLVDFWQQRLQAYEVGGVQPQASPVNQAIAGPQGIKPE